MRTFEVVYKFFKESLVRKESVEAPTLQSALNTITLEKKGSMEKGHLVVLSVVMISK